MKRIFRQHSILPCFRVTLGFSLFYLSLMVLLPLSALILFSLTKQEFHQFATTISSPRVIASFQLSFSTAAIAALLNTIFGSLIAWVLVRYQFPGKRIMDALIDLPFAMPTAVSGIALAAIYSTHGWIGQFFSPYGIKLAFNPTGIVIALTFIGLPFVVRTMQPVLKEQEPELEEAAACLGASRWTTFRQILLPVMLPAAITGFALAFARAVGEYGSVIFIAGNLPMVSEIAPLMIMSHLEEYDYAGAAAIATVMLGASFLLLLLVNLLQAWTWRKTGGARS